MNKPINIVMSTDNNFQFAYVAIYSILYNQKESTVTNFFILTPHFFCEEAKDELESLIGLYKNSKIFFIDVGGCFDGVKSSVKHITAATFYRLMIPEIISKEKCIYLDTDIIVCDDLTECYSEDISGYMVGGVPVIAWCSRTEEAKRKHCQIVGINDLDSYVNAGVLLMNLERMRDNKFTQKAMALIDMNYPMQDQDIVNKVCYKYIKKIAYRYNAMTKYFNMEYSEYNNIYSEHEIIDAWNKPVIIHYADWRKPWTCCNVPLGEQWWFYCKRTKMWDYYVHRPIDDMLFNIFYENYGEGRRNREIWDRIRSTGMVIVYGAGKLAKKIIRDLADCNINIFCVAVTSQRSNPAFIEQIPVYPIGKIERRDLPVIIAVNNSYRSEIIRVLWDNGFNNIITLYEDRL